MKENKFIIIVPFYNVEKWIKTTIQSIKNQTYQNFEVYFSDDCSSDNSKNLIKPFIDNNKFFLIENEKRRLALSNICNAIKIADPNDEDIIVNLDGDDWFSCSNALEIVNSYYQDDTMLTYGNYIHYPDGFIPSNVINYSEDIIKKSDYRKDIWRASALRTFKYLLWKNIKEEDLKDQTGNYYEMAWDLAYMFPMLEMADDRWKCVKEIIYCYNLLNPINDHKKDRDKQIFLDLQIRNKKKYVRL